MNDKTRDFLKEIQIPFCWKLYSRLVQASWDPDVKITTGFPYCCYLASQLIGSFLFSHFSGTTVCVGAVTHSKHFWCELDGDIIDFTDFQFEGMNAEVREKFKNRLWKYTEFSDFIKTIPIIYSPMEHSHKLSPFERLVTCELLLVEEAKMYAPNKNEFLKFIDENIDNPVCQNSCFIPT